jgi:hypothetical protein
MVTLDCKGSKRDQFERVCQLTPDVSLEPFVSVNNFMIALDMIFVPSNDKDISIGLGFNHMKFQKLFSDDTGESHWEDIDITLEERSFAPPAQDIEISEPELVKQTMFLRLRSGWNEPIHPTPVAQKLICLAGTVRVTASDG